MSKTLYAIAVLLFSMTMFFESAAQTQPKTFRLDSADGLDVIGGKVEAVTYRGHKAVRLTPSQDHGADDSMLAMLPPAFQDGVIEVDLAGAPRADADESARGFIGIAFRVQPHASRFECIYLRPTNGRSNDQVRRNHSTQYVSAPDYPWERLRKESPGVYESYVDLESGAWTKIKIVVAGTTARLYVNGADQPALIVNDLKLGKASGQIALWAHWTTDAYFSNLTVK